MTTSQTKPRETERDGTKSPFESTPDVSRYLARYEVTIIITRGSRRGAAYPLRRERLTIGRDRAADLVFDDDLMSRVHATLEFEDGTFHLRDLDSRNGTQLNDRPVTSSRLKDGDSFQIGNHGFLFAAKDRHPPSITRSETAKT
jgi:pSer/pThr/pTyr-binding forkhead associated (FHA) protein